MDSQGESNLRKLALGGCGTQVGLVVGFTALAAGLLFCSVCAVTNLLSIAVVEQLVASATTEVMVEPETNGQVEVLEGEIDLLLSEVELLQQAEPANVPPAPAVPAMPVAPSAKPLVIAHKGQVNLRSGPGTSYPRLGVLTHGGALEIAGRNNDSTWWLVSTPNGLAWVCADIVLTVNMNDDIPVVTIPSLLVLPATNSPPPPNSTPDPPNSDPVTPTPSPPQGTPTASAAESRIRVEDTVGYKRLFEQLSNDPTSASFSTRGDRIAVADGVGVYIVAGDGSQGEVLLQNDGTMTPTGGVVWSPDEKYLAFVAERKLEPKGRFVGLIRLSDMSISYLKPPGSEDVDAPRWTQDGQLLVNVYPGEPADGTTYVYNIYGEGKPASGVYVLSSSHEGQKWLPWLPGRTWKSGVSERPDTYYVD